MTKPIPKRALGAGLAILGALGLLVGLAADFGVRGAWFWGVAAGAVAAGATAFAARHRDVTLAEAVVVVLVATVGYLIADGRKTSDDLRHARAQQKLDQPTVPKTRFVNFVVVKAEPDPRPDASFSYDDNYAYKRAQPESDVVPPGGQVQKGAAVKVVCAANVHGDRWYKMSDGTFMGNGTIEQARYSGPPPAECS